MEDTLREILSETANLSVPAATIGSGDDLFACGLTSFATVGVMLAVESAFDVEFPDSLLVRSTFSSIDSLASAVNSLTGS
ncbi:acyl carrier protein [Robbsia sp. KACC 23696]|uniref:acyl carrier protein n=1 Tax=Robbsia sp. KACC 23696 TaxID=3149231 RepID=UPI00325A95A2